MRSVRRRVRGFTLIEILVVIVIIGILATLVVPKLMSRPDEARVVAGVAGQVALTKASQFWRALPLLLECEHVLRHAVKLPALHGGAEQGAGIGAGVDAVVDHTFTSLRMSV